MKKILFTLPVLLIGITACPKEKNTTIGKLSKLKVSDISEIILVDRGLRTVINNTEYKVSEEYLSSIAEQILNYEIELTEEICECSKYYYFKLFAGEDRYEFGQHSFTSYVKNKTYHYKNIEQDKYFEFVNYTKERSNIVS